MTDPTQTIGVNRFRPGRRPDTTRNLGKDQP